MITVELTGAQRLRAAIADLKATPKWLRTSVRKELEAVPGIIRPPVVAEIATVMPASYAPILSGSLTVTATVLRTGWVRVRIRGQARGHKQLRDLGAMDNRGILRHPRFGDVRRGQPWYNTAIRPGVWSRPVDARTDQIITAVDAAVDRVAARLQG